MNQGIRSLNSDLGRLVAHSVMHELAWCLATTFSAVFLYKQGLSASDIYLVLVFTIALRLIFRPLVLITARRAGLRTTVIIGALLTAAQNPVIALVQGPGPMLVIYSVTSALAQVFYWSSYHALFAIAGETGKRGEQVGWRQLLMAAVGILGPVAGGLMLELGGGPLAFGTGAAIEMLATLPLLGLKEPPPEPGDSLPFAVALRGTVISALDAWIFNSSNWAWSLILFQALGAEYIFYGAALAAARFAGALGGLAFGRFLDSGNTRRAVWTNAGVLAGILVAKAFCGNSLNPILIVSIGATALGGLYTPSLMTAIYNESSISNSPLRYQLLVEAGWDVGGLVVCLLAATMLAAAQPLQSLVLLAVIAVPLQALLLCQSFAAYRLSASRADVQTQAGRATSR